LLTERRVGSYSIVHLRLFRAGKDDMPLNCSHNHSDPMMTYNVVP